MFKTFTFTNIYSYKKELLRNIISSKKNLNNKSILKRSDSCPLF